MAAENDRSAPGEEAQDAAPPKPGGQGPRPLGGWRIVLFASLALNLLVLGLVAGAFVRAGGPMHGDGRPGFMDELGYGPFGAALSRDDRRQVGSRMLERAGDLRQNRDALRGQVETLIAALRAVPFDAAGVQAMADEQQRIINDRQRIGQALLIERIAAMSDEERAAYADRLERSLRFGRERR